MPAGPEGGPSSTPGDPGWTVSASGGWPGVPERPRQFVMRPRLLDLLDAEPGCSLVLVSAPAGTGKTSLVVDWVTTRAPAALEWVTFDPGDAFWPAFAGALERLGVTVPVGCAPDGDAPLDPGARRELALAIASGPESLTVVVDGLDVDSLVLAGDIDFLLRHTGHQLRIVLLTRADPVLPLYRYRLAASMTEVRMADLALTDEEAAGVLASMGVEVPPEVVHALNRRTRGWVTGTRFAGKFLGEKHDHVADVTEFLTESDSIAEYLMGEVLATQPPDVVDLLMTMSVPDAIEPELADALGGHGAARSLASLARVNVFVERVPAHPAHFRFHPFFRDLLRAELRYRSPSRLDELQRRAADWYAERGRLTSAARHYAAVEAWTEVARLVVEHDAWCRLLFSDGTHPLVRTLREIPASLQAPEAVAVRAALALTDHDERRCDDELAGLDGVAASERVRRACALLRAVRAGHGVGPGEALALAEAAESAVATEEDGAEPGLLALAHLMSGSAMLRDGEVDGARERLLAAVATSDSQASPAVLVAALGQLALLSCGEGDLQQAASYAARATRAATDAGLTVVDRSPAAEIAAAWVALEQFELRAASEHVRAAEREGFVLDDPVAEVLLVLVRARLRAAQGDRAPAAAEVSTALEALEDGDRWLAARLRLELVPWLVARGETDAALRLVAELDEAVAGPAAALARGQAHLASGQEGAAARELARARDAGSPVPVRVTAALTEGARLLRAGHAAAAHQAVLEALNLARTGLLRRPFHEAPVQIRQLVKQDRQLAGAHPWLHGHSAAAAPKPRPRVAPEPRTAMAPVEQLTEKELEVLRHLAELLTTEEIAAEMYISVNTVRTHVRNILRKLGASRRNAAVRIAREYELIPS